MAGGQQGVGLPSNMGAFPVTGFIEATEQMLRSKNIARATRIRMGYLLIVVKTLLSSDSGSPTIN